MSDLAGPTSDLHCQMAALSTSCRAREYPSCGFHQDYELQVSKIRDACELFLNSGYVLEMLTCQDRRESEQVMRLCYSFNDLDTVDRHLIHVNIDVEREEVPSLCSLSGAANWMEREVFEMYGVRFLEHPQLERLLLPEDADFFPLRKDFGRIEDADEGDAEGGDA